MSVSDDDLVESWRTRRPLSAHTLLELAYGVRAGHRPGDSPPLAPGEPVPGCGCPRCSSVDEDDDVRDLFKREWKGSAPLPVEEARRVPLLDVCRWLGLGEPTRPYSSSRELRVRCPLHADETPSLTVSPDKGLSGLWFCFPCGEGGDGIELVERAKRMRFHEAVKWIAEGGP